MTDIHLHTECAHVGLSVHASVARLLAIASPHESGTASGLKEATGEFSIDQDRVNRLESQVRQP